ncbi:hypothetical protein [Parasitella parasitica]|uniref:Helitron helicase-like domain-containing protein n=1 Tax=Parasitella parasitica TaxID=35722 RepID=A0A0B7MZJ3_9FUNG|nr:hypothetical protein [Parasitella parasitica]CEP18588.1 hypothetical protein [Parasitella parasitica]
MVHGPCGDINPNSPCMQKDVNGVLKCSKRFPKTFSESTIINEDGYPQYKRTRSVDTSTLYTIPNPGRQNSGRFTIDNRWIVPFNPYLSKKYKAHINVECCQSVQAVKYINKNIYKGSDRTTLRVSDTENEIDKYLQSRYIGPTEAFSRIFEYKIHEEDPTVTLLPIHLPNQQPVFFSEDSSPNQIQTIL